MVVTRGVCQQQRNRVDAQPARAAPGQLQEAQRSPRGQWAPDQRPPKGWSGSARGAAVLPLEPMRLIGDLHVLEVAELVEVLTTVVGAEVQLQVVADSGAHEGLRPAAVAPIGGVQFGCQGGVHGCAPLHTVHLSDGRDRLGNARGDI